MMPEACKRCGHAIQTMCMNGTGFCSQNCQDSWMACDPVLSLPAGVGLYETRYSA